MIKAYVIYGLGIGCHAEVAHAFERAGAQAELIHMNRILSGDVDIFDAQIINYSGGFLQGDILGAGMCAANQLEHAVVNGQRLKDRIIEHATAGNIHWGQCNGLQLLVKAGLLPGIGGDYSKQTVTLTYNDCGIYRVAPVFHRVEMPHFAFEGIDYPDLVLWCRHGEGKIQFYSDYGLVSEEEGEENRRRVNEDHVLLRYVDPATGEATEQFPHNPNGSVDGIAGLVSNPARGIPEEGTIFGHMAHPEVGVYRSRDPRWFAMKDQWRRQGIKAADIDEKRLEGIGLKIFQNVVGRFD